MSDQFPLETRSIFDLPKGEAEIVLNRFLALENAFFQNLEVGVNLDYSERSVISLFRHVCAEIALLPGWEVDQHAWHSRLGYYFGEAMVRASSALKWGIGHHRSAFKNHPVVVGFSHGIEAATINISYVICSGILLRQRELVRIDEVVGRWFARVPVS